MRKDTHKQTGQEWVFQVIGSVQNCLSESHATESPSAELASMYIKAVTRMANSCAKPECQDLLNTYLFRKTTWSNPLEEKWENKLFIYVWIYVF